MILVFADLRSSLMKNRISFLKNLNQNVVLVHNADGRDLPFNNFLGFKVIEQSKIKNSKLRYYLSFIQTLYFIVKYRPKVIIVHWASRLYQNIALSLFGSKVVVHTMGGDIDTLQEAKGKKYSFIKILLKKVKVITVKSTYMKNMIYDNFKLKKDISIINWGIEQRFYRKKTKTIDTNCLKFFCMRAMRPFYNKIEVLLSFIDYINKTGRSDILYISTFNIDNDYFSELSRVLNENLKVKNLVKFVNIEHKELPQFFDEVDFVISNTNSDGLSQSIMESLYAKKFLLVKKIPNNEEYLNENNSIVFDKINSNVFINASNLSNKEYICENIEVFDIKKQQDKYLSLLQTIDNTISRM
jgi:hypothetical protein